MVQRPAGRGVVRFTLLELYIQVVVVQMPGTN